MRRAMRLVAVVLVVVVGVAPGGGWGADVEEGEGGVEWAYDHQDAWDQVAPACSQGQRQSPINIRTSGVVLNNTMALQLENYDQLYAFESKITPYTLSIRPASDGQPEEQARPKPTVRLSWLPNDYELHELHFHWGDNQTSGSEHTIDSQHGDAEFHLVHLMKGVKAEDLDKVPDSLVVIGVQVRVGSLYPDKVFDDFIAGAEKAAAATASGQKATVQVDSIYDLLPVAYHSFYTYPGSLTSPQCQEVVTWVLWKSPVYISKERLTSLLELSTGNQTNHHHLGPNFRQTQPLNNRTVYMSFNVSD